MHIKSLMTKPALIQLMSFGTMMLDQFKAEYVGMQVVSIYGKLALEQTKKKATVRSGNFGDEARCYGNLD